MNYEGIECTVRARPGREEWAPADPLQRRRQPRRYQFQVDRAMRQAPQRVEGSTIGSNDKDKNRRRDRAQT
jgi:hypothetical protein